jgi:putative ABC transport system permease protein
MRLASFALQSLKARSIRSWITIFGIIVSIAVIYILLTLSSGLSDAVISVFDDFGTNRVFILPTGDIGGLNSKPFDMNLVHDVENLGLFELVIPGFIRNAEEVVFKGRSAFLTVNALPTTDVDLIEHNLNYDTDIVQGRFFRENEQFVAIIGHNVAYDPDDVLFQKSVSLRQSLEINGTRFDVVGILKEYGSPDDNSIIIPLSNAKDIYGLGETVSYMDAIIKDSVEITLAKQRVDRLLERRLGEDTYLVITPDAILRQFMQTLFIVQALLLAIASVSLIVGAIGIANTMFTAVLEREKEIGIMKSIGAKNKDILFLFMLESGLIGMIGGFVGVILGIGLSFIIGVITKAIGFQYLTISINPLFVLGCLVFAFFVGVGSGFLPSYLASKKKIIDTLRDG